MELSFTFDMLTECLEASVSLKREADDSSQKPRKKKFKLCSQYLRSVKACTWGDDCFFAHNEEDLKPHHHNKVVWSGNVGVGELIYQQLGIIEAPGCLNVTCNRNTPLGNPFVNAEPRYEKIRVGERCGECHRSGDDKDHPQECNCLIAEHHVALCDGFQEFWDRLLGSTEDQLDLSARALAEEIAERRGGLLISRRWAWFAFSRRSTLNAFQRLEEIHRSGKARLVLLCHCGVVNPAKPCHATIIQRQLAASSHEAAPISALEPKRKCEHCNRDWLWRGAFDAKKNKFFCAVCWFDFVGYVYEAELKYPLPDAPLLQPADETP